MTDQTSITKPLVDDFMSQLAETATITVDPEHGTTGVHIDGLVDVNALVGHALAHAAHVVRHARIHGANVDHRLDRTMIADMLDEQAKLVRQ
jgi:hypothetical protein